MKAYKLLLGAAVLLGLTILGLHMAGLRPHTAIISGMQPAQPQDAIWGLAYALSWFAGVLLAPILGLASLLLRIMR